MQHLQRKLTTTSEWQSPLHLLITPLQISCLKRSSSQLLRCRTSQFYNSLYFSSLFSRAHLVMRRYYSSLSQTFQVQDTSHGTAVFS